jgi:hypothetical protein
MLTFLLYIRFQTKTNAKNSKSIEIYVTGLSGVVSVKNYMRLLELYQPFDV